MPWKEVDFMDQRLEFVERSFQKELSFTDLCKAYGISTKTGYKWKERFYEQGISGLYDQSRKPLSSPNQLPEETICEITRIKQTKKNWGPKKIRMVFANNHKDDTIPSLSTVERILKKAGFVEISKRKTQKNSK